MTSILYFIYLTWFELFLFIIIIPILGFLIFGYLAKLPFVLRILRKSYFRHWIIMPNAFVISRIILTKDVQPIGKFSMIAGVKSQGNKPRYILKSEKEYKFYFGGDLTIAHRYNDPNPLEFMEVKDMLFVRDNNSMSALDLGTAIDSDDIKDLNRSTFGKKDTMVLLFVMGILAMQALTVYLTYETSQSLNQVITFLNHFATSGTPIP